MRTTWMIAATAWLGAMAFPAPAAQRPTVPAGFELRGDGLLVHKQSGARFPLHVGDFTRVDNDNFDPKGRDVVVAYRYQRDRDPVIARVALIHMEMLSARAHFNALRPVVGQYFDDLKLTDVRLASEGPLGLPGVKPEFSWQGRFSARHQGRPYELSLSTVDFGYWDARVTAAYPRAQAPDAQAHIRALIAELRRIGPRAFRA